MKNHLGGTSKCLETTIWTTTAETTARITAETARTAKTDIKTVNVEELLHGAIRAQLLFHGAVALRN